MTDSTDGDAVGRNATIALFETEELAEDAVRALEHGGYDIEKLSIIARGMSSERHVVGFDTTAHRVGRWGGFGAAGGALSGALLFVPGIGHVALGGYVLYLVATGAVGAGVGALGAALSSIGIADDEIIRYETAIKADKFVLVAHGTVAEVERAREILGTTAAESIDVHAGATVA